MSMQYDPMSIGALTGLAEKTNNNSKSRPT